MKIPIHVKYLFLIASIIACIFFLQSYASYSIVERNYSFNLDYSIPDAVIPVFLWIAFSYLIYPLSSSFLRKLKKASFRNYLVQFFLSVFLSILQAFLSRVILHGFLYLLRKQWYPLSDGHSLEGIVAAVFSTLIIYWIIAASFAFVDYYKEYLKQQVQLAQMENALNNAQLNALKMQLNPHFLFNTLNSVSSLMGKNDLGQKVLSRLASLLRRMLEQEQKHKITLGEEIRYIQDYLYIEEVRFQDRLAISYDLESGVENCLVPNLILQPLVENAIKHGFSKRIDSGKIEIKAFIRSDKLHLKVADDGKGMRDTRKLFEQSGIGLSNSKARLEQLYADHYTIRVHSNLNEGFEIELSVPCERDNARD